MIEYFWEKLNIMIIILIVFSLRTKLLENICNVDCHF